MLFRRIDPRTLKKFLQISNSLTAINYVLTHSQRRPDFKYVIALDTYLSEFQDEVYWQLIDFEEQLEFIRLDRLLTLQKSYPLYFNGEYVKIIRIPDKTSLTYYRYYVHCASLSKTFGNKYYDAMRLFSK